MCAWTYSSLRKLHLPLMTELGRHCRERVTSLTPQNLAWVASSFAKLSVRDEVWQLCCVMWLLICCYDISIANDDDHW
jgi:hypothetical protein